MKQWLKRAAWAGAVLLPAIMALALWRDAPPPLPPALPLAALAGGDADFARVEGLWQFRFPADHGPHPDYRMETWTFTGSLNARGRRLGFQLAFFRLALTPHPPASPSAWATNQAYRAHFVVADESGQVYAAERFSRAALGLSGGGHPPRVWLENWEARADGERGFRLRAADQDMALELRLDSRKPPLEAGGGGIAGAAFHGYALTRLRARGRLRLGGETLAVQGTAWLDRAWGMLPPPGGQVALNRFALHLDDGRDIALFQLHRRDGSGAPATTGVLVAQDGSTRPLARRDIALEALDYWTSPRGVRYPVRWRLRLADNMDLTLTPLAADQEPEFALRYWGGTVTVAGTVSGSGYVELTGYGG